METTAPGNSLTARPGGVSCTYRLASNHVSFLSQPICARLLRRRNYRRYRLQSTGCGFGAYRFPGLPPLHFRAPAWLGLAGWLAGTIARGRLGHRVASMVSTSV
jgi:hypothetical protein